MWTQWCNKSYRWPSKSGNCAACWTAAGPASATRYGLRSTHRHFCGRPMVSQTRSARLFFPREYGGEGDMGGALSAFETIALVDLSLLVKIGVQYGLFGGVIRRLGTKRHHERYLRQAMTMELPGCFAMTETGHGSDVQSIRTTATYDPQRQEFVVHTPDDDARKDYIGNVARDGRMAAVFAQLITGGEPRGVHVVLVPIRDERGRPCPNVRIEDCGHKGGL